MNKFIKKCYPYSFLQKTNIQDRISEITKKLLSLQRFFKNGSPKEGKTVQNQGV